MGGTADAAFGSTATEPTAPAVTPQIERFVRQLVVTYKSVVLYPPASAIPRDNGTAAATLLTDALGEAPDMRFGVTKKGLSLGDSMVFPEQPAFVRFAKELYNRNLAEVRFHPGAGMRDIVSFLSIMRSTPAEIIAAGGFESRLWELGVDNITVTEAQVSFVDPVDDEGDVDDVTSQLSTEQIDELIASAYAGRSRDQRVLTRFIGQPHSVNAYLSDLFRSVGAGMEGLVTATERFSELAEIAAAQPVEERESLYAELAEALTQLDPEMRRRLLSERLLPEAKTSQPITDVVRQLPLEDVCDMLVAETDASEATHEGLARAIRNLALISQADRSEIVAAASDAMRRRGFDETVVSSIAERVAPSRVEVREIGQESREKPVDTIFKLMDLAPVASAKGDELDPEVDVIKQEASRGVTDGDVITALVTLVTLDAREMPFATTMALLEDSLDLLIERGEIEIAAYAAETLDESSHNPELSEQQQRRLRRAIELFSKPGDIRTISQVLRVYPAESAEHIAALKIVRVLGPCAIQPMLEQLAEEQDMTARKSIVELLCGLATDYIDQFGSEVGDERWYFVRNVVAILGSTRSPAILPYLERTIRHVDPRVRRETIRAASTVHDRIATDVLVMGLSDTDPQNVQLAARYLGAAGERRTIHWLQLVAVGEGRGNRDVAVRTEAIRALGRLGAPEALPTLHSITTKRSLLGAARDKELKAAAEEAIARIEAQGVVT